MARKGDKTGQERSARPVLAEAMGTPIVGSRGWSRCFLADSRQNQCAGIRGSAGTSTQCALAEAMGSAKHVIKQQTQERDGGGGNGNPFDELFGPGGRAICH
ncbi:hypothetical protein HB773_07025 [Sinorhizobium meliloti]|nr:hypothetical protein HB773_07025 [Sinorhizobium meliloti]